jgi:tRNA-specific 2-thiouridylase
LWWNFPHLKGYWCWRTLLILTFLCHYYEKYYLAAKAGLITADKRDSQGLCFIGKVKLPDFLQQQLKPKKGEIIEIDRYHSLFKVNKTKMDSPLGIDDLLSKSQKYSYHRSDGKVVGEHNGAYYFTIGQRKGLNVGGTPLPLFVLETDTQMNIIYVGQGAEHPGLLRPALRVKTEDIHWLRSDLRLKSSEQKEYSARIRYRQSLQKAVLYQEEEYLFIVFDNAQTGIAAGQFVAWYEDDELIGSGVID